MRDLVVRKKLEALAADAAERFRELIRAGEEVPYEVKGPGEGSPFAQYMPMVGRFVREHAAVVRRLDTFAEACAAIGSASLAGLYLEQLGEPVAADEDARVEDAAIAFLSRLWEGCSEFTLEGDRLDAALRELEGAGETPEGEAEVVAPLIGLHMPTTRLAVSDVTVIRADVVEVPDEVRRREGSRRAAWEPQFLAVVRGGVAAPDEDGGAAGDAGAVAPGTALRRLITTLRLFKPGGVALGPYAWARTPGDRWRRLATAVAPPRPGGYRLAESELGDVAALARTLADRTEFLGASSHMRLGAGGTLVRALSRFEVGLERAALLEALSDYVLTLRYLLDGGGAAGVGLAMRVAAICAEPSGRPAIKAEVERALALERALMRGEVPSVEQGSGPLELVAAIEERTRTILRDAASGRLGADLRAAADEVLLADGLAVGEGAADLRGATAEWQAVPARADHSPDPQATKARDLRADRAVSGDSTEASAPQEDGAMQETEDEQPTRVMMDAESTENEPRATDWLSEVDECGDTLDWPERPDALKILDRRPAERERARRRVRHLFPRPETTEWGVAELRYERRKTRV